MKQGFFTAKQTQSNSRPDGKTYSCASCGLTKGCNTPKMKSYGKGKKGILVIGEAPGKVEDQRGLPWQGKTGRLLQNTLRWEMDTQLFENCVCLNAVNCRPPDNRKPTNYEISCCRKHVFHAIKRYKPKVIILMGSAALYSVLGHRWKHDLGGIMKWQGWCIPDRELNAWVCPTFHPSFVHRGEREVRVIWERDLQRAVDKATEPLPEYKEPDIEFITDLTPLKKQIQKLASFDYETTGIKPQARGHRIVVTSVAVSESKVFTFPMPSTRRERKPFTDFLLDPDIGKMAHNMKFEDTWSRVRLRTQVQNWEWDSMMAAHVLDNRSGITGLKFQTYANFGIIDYDSEVAPYLLSNDKSGNAINKVEELMQSPQGKRQLLKYCALDSLYEYRLARLQMKQMDYSNYF